MLAENGEKWKLKFQITEFECMFEQKGRSTECLEWESLVSVVRAARWCALHPFFLA
jgi:hypothetical protein